MHHLFAWTILAMVIVFTSCGSGEQQPGSGTTSLTGALSLETINTKIAGDEKNPDLYEMRAKYFLADRQPEKAITDINKAISLKADYPDYYITLSDIYLLMGKPQNCGDALKHALGINPKNNEALLKLGKLNLVLKEYKTAFEYLNRALEYQSVNPQVYFTRAIALLEKGDTLKAVDDLRKAVDQDQQYFDAYLELGELYSIRKDRMASDYLKNALKVRPNDKVALYMLGMYYQEAGSFDQAILTYTDLMKSDSTYRNAPYNIGYIYLVYLKDFPKAIDYFSRALRADPAYYEAFFNRGFAFELMREYTKAAADYKQTLNIKPNYEKAVEGLNRLDRSK